MRKMLEHNFVGYVMFNYGTISKVGRESDVALINFGAKKVWSACCICISPDFPIIRTSRGVRKGRAFVDALEN